MIKWIKWRLTIKQTRPSEYSDRMNVETLVFEHDCLNKIVELVNFIESSFATENVAYEISSTEGDDDDVS